MKHYQEILPEYPRTPHLPYNQNMVKGDILGDTSLDFLFSGKNKLIIEEKIDGSSVRICYYDDNFIVGNRDHILKKGFLKNTPAKLQFRPLWNWAYQNKDKFLSLNKEFGYSVGLYGEWLWAIHGIIYNKLPSYFIALDIFDPAAGKFVATLKSRTILGRIGFTCPPLIKIGLILSLKELDDWCNETSTWGEEKREGLYFKISDKNYLVERYKMVRQEYKQGYRWNEKELQRQPELEK